MGSGLNRISHNIVDTISPVGTHCFAACLGRGGGGCSRISDVGGGRLHVAGSKVSLNISEQLG